jgi:hypothetical protein
MYSRETSFLGYFQAKRGAGWRQEHALNQESGASFRLIEKEKALDHAGDAAAGCEAHRG